MDPEEAAEEQAEFWGTTLQGNLALALEPLPSDEVSDEELETRAQLCMGTPRDRGHGLWPQLAGEVEASLLQCMV